VGAAILAFFVWFSAGAAQRPAIVTPAHSAIATGAETDLYPLLARGFLHGHLYLDAAVPTQLAGAADPYNPAGRPVPYLHDVSLFSGRYYLYFGPAPALTLFLPYRLLTGRDLPSPAAVLFFCLWGYAGLVALVVAAAGAGLTGKPWPLGAAVLIGLAALSCYLPLLRRAAVYEVAIAGGSAFFLWSFYFLLRMPQVRRPRRAAAWAGALLGLAVACRPTYGLCLAPLAAGLLLLHRPRSARQRAGDFTAAVAAFGFLLGLLLLYNFLRFGSATEFGQTYQLSGAREGAVRHFSLSYLPFQAHAYLFSCLHPSRYYPFLHALAPPSLPPGIGGYEFTFGLFAGLPAAAFAVVASVALFRPAAARRGPALVLFGAFAAMLLPLLFYFGCCVRYMADFAPILAVLAGLGMVEAAGWTDRHRPALTKTIVGLAGVSALASLAVGFLSSVDMYDRSAETPPPAFDRLDHGFNRPTVAWNEAHGIVFGPRRLQLALPAQAHGSEVLLVAQDDAGAWDALQIDYSGHSTIRFSFLRDGPRAVDRSPPVTVTDRPVHTVTISWGALLPLRPGELAHPVPRTAFTALRTWLHVEWNGQVVWECPVAPRLTRFEHISVGQDEIPSLPPPFSGKVLHTEVLSPAAVHLNRPAVGGVALQLRLTPAMAGRAFPLATTGHDGNGNILLLAVARNGTVRLGYDHWGKPTLWSAEISTPLNSFHRVEFWLPSILDGNPPPPLVVRWDGRTVWREAVPYFVAGREEVFLGRDPLGGTDCEPALINATWARTDLPAPP